MDNTIDIRQPVAELISQHPELKDLLIELGLPRHEQNFTIQGIRG